MTYDITHRSFSHMSRSDTLGCSQNELQTHAIHPEHTTREVCVVSADKVNHWFSRFKAMRAMQELCVDMKGTIVQSLGNPCMQESHVDMSGYNRSKLV